MTLKLPLHGPFFAYMVLLVSLFFQENFAALLKEGKPSMQVASHPTAAAHQDIPCRTVNAKQQGRSPALPQRHPLPSVLQKALVLRSEAESSSPPLQLVWGVKIHPKKLWG